MPEQPRPAMAITWQPTLIQRIGLTIAYAAAWAGLFLVSDAFWFLPAGLRMAALVIVPWRQWGWVLLGEWLGGMGINGVRGLLDQPQFWVPTLTLLYMATYPLLTSWWRVTWGDPLASLLGLFGVAASCAVISAVAVALIEQSHGLSWEALSAVPAYAQGDFLGILLLTPVLLAARTAGRPYPRWPFLRWGVLVAAAPTLTFVVLREVDALTPIVPLTLGASALLFAAYFLGWRGASMANLALSAAVYLAGSASARLNADELQLIIAMMALASLLLGAAADRARQRLRQLEAEREEVRRMATRLSSAQEAERNRIGRDLHDALGQTLTAARGRLHLARRESIGTPATQALDELRDLLAHGHGELHAVIGALHPTELVRLGLESALRGGGIASMLADAGIAFDCEIALDQPLSDEAAIGVYRICQEAATNVVKARQARSFTLSLLGRETAGGQAVELHLGDDGARVAPDAVPGQGLQNIRDRALALRAEYRFDPDDGGQRHWLRFIA